MKIVSDRAMDLAPKQLEGLDITYAPLRSMRRHMPAEWICSRMSSMN
jgi:hypothetical protein